MWTGTGRGLELVKRRASRVSSVGETSVYRHVLGRGVHTSFRNRDDQVRNEDSTNKSFSVRTGTSTMRTPPGDGSDSGNRGRVHNKFQFHVDDDGHW